MSPPSVPGRLPAPHSVCHYDTTLPTSFCPLSWYAPPSLSPSSSLHLVVPPCLHHCVSLPCLHHRVSPPCPHHHVLPPPLLHPPICLVISFVSLPLHCITLCHPVCDALTAPFVALPQCVALSAEVICAVGDFLFFFFFFFLH